MKFRYDLHLHSCLSPCGDDTMTPASIAGLARLEGLDLVALTDHNSAANCPAFLRAAEAYGIAAMPGLELTTSEDVHVLCLFPSLEGALAFSEYVEQNSVSVPNRPDIFGRQTIMSEDDEALGEVSRLLISASGIGFNSAQEAAAAFGGLALPAHIDKPSNGALAILGAIPPEAGFFAAELSPRGALSLLPDGFAFLRNSDAHTPDAIGSAGGILELDCDPAHLIPALITHLKGVHPPK